MREPFKLLISACCCLATSTLLTSLLASWSWDLANNADLYIDVNSESARAQGLSPLEYDDCGGILKGLEKATKDTENPYTGMDTTKWSSLFRFNAILYTMIATLCGASLLCACYAPCMVCTVPCFLCSGIPTMTAIILTGYRLKNQGGDLC